jgi:anthranilate synthase/aminodeoxychorismate synthase-like glutamine amidotransferase
MLLLVDNYDSFTYNLAQAFGALGAPARVLRHDEATVAELLALAPSAVVISPGPGGPADAGISCDLIRACLGRVPLLGVCLGLQCLAAVCGGRVARAPEPVHGKTSPVGHDGRGVFSGLPDPFPAMRYHSLAVDEASLPASLEVTARAPDGVIMGLRLRRARGAGTAAGTAAGAGAAVAEGVQFHPESILTREGPRLLANFLALAREARA